MSKTPQQQRIAVPLKAPVAEIFFSYQGEGMYVGQPQVFVRFAGCNLRCNYCDTPHSQRLASDQQFYSVAEITREALRLMKENRIGAKNGAEMTVSLTGGEPLLYSQFLERLLPELKRKKFAVYLETNATLPAAYAVVSPWIDIVSADIKLPSSCGEALWDEHAAFLKKAGKKAFVKLVLTEHTTADEFERAVSVTARVSKHMPFVLQPATPVPGTRSVAPARLFSWASRAREKLTRVHVLPQMHKIWKIE